MNAEIKSVHLLDEWDASQVDIEFYSNLEIEIGPTGVNTSDLFNIDVCNLKWIINNLSQNDVHFLNKLLVTNDFSELFLANILSKKIASINAKEWPDLAKVLSLLFNWEYDAYIDN